MQGSEQQKSIDRQCVQTRRPSHAQANHEVEVADEVQQSVLSKKFRPDCESICVREFGQYQHQRWSNAYDQGMGNRGEVFMTWEGFEPGTWSLELWDLKRFELRTL